MGPLGCTPRVMWEALAGGDLDDRGCVREVNELSFDYNERLLGGIDDLNTRLQGARIVFCDVYSGMMEIIANPGNYGEKETKSSSSLFLFS